MRASPSGGRCGDPRDRRAGGRRSRWLRSVAAMPVARAHQPSAAKDRWDALAPVPRPSPPLPRPRSSAGAGVPAGWGRYQSLRAFTEMAETPILCDIAFEECVARVGRIGRPSQHPGYAQTPARRDFTLEECVSRVGSRVGFPSWLPSWWLSPAWALACTSAWPAATLGPAPAQTLRSACASGPNPHFSTSSR